MFPYRVKYTESESDIQKNNLLYRIDQQCQNTFEVWEPYMQFLLAKICHANFQETPGRPL